MPTLKTGSATIVAIAALCLAATSAKAAVVNLVVDQSLSSLKLNVVVDASALGGPGASNLVAGPQVPAGPGFAGSDIASYFGTINIDLQPGTIQLLPGSSIVAATTGNYAPQDLGPGNDPVGGVGPANYGLVISPTLPLIPAAAFNSLVLDFGVPVQAAIPAGIPSTPMPLIAGSFNLTGQGMSFTQGRTVGLVFDPNLKYEDDVTGFPTIFSTAGVDTGTWDGTTLTFTVNSTLTYPFGPAFVTQGFTGTIVAHVIPEPSTMIMAGLGVVGLVAAGYRARKRKV